MTPKAFDPDHCDRCEATLDRDEWGSYRSDVVEVGYEATGEHQMMHLDCYHTTQMADPDLIAMA